jgi:hypothetical protein
MANQKQKLAALVKRAEAILAARSFPANAENLAADLDERTQLGYDLLTALEVERLIARKTLMAVRERLYGIEHAYGCELHAAASCTCGLAAVGTDLDAILGKSGMYHE